MNGRSQLSRRRRLRLYVLLLAGVAVLMVPQALSPDQRRYQAPSRQPAPERVMTMEVTAYTTSIEDCGKTDGITATGTIAGPGTIGSDWSVLPPGTRVEVPGYGDRGDGARGNRLDVWLSSRSECFAWGRRRLEVKILQ